MLVEFSGVNSSPCAEMRLRFAQAEWKRRIDKFVGVRLFVDQVLHVSDPAERRRLQKLNFSLQLDLLRDVAVPSYVIIDPKDRTVLATYIGMESPNNAGTFAKFLADGWQHWEARSASSARDKR